MAPVRPPLQRLSCAAMAGVRVKTQVDVIERTGVRGHPPVYVAAQHAIELFRSTQAARHRQKAMIPLAHIA